MIYDRLLGCESGQSRIHRFQKEYLSAKGCHPDQEEKLAYTMFIDDIQDIRNLVADALRSTLTGQL